MSKSMTKSELVQELSDRAFTTRKQTAMIIESLIEIVSREAVNGFTIPGLCKFEITDRKARKGRNPQTGETIDIPATKSLKIRPMGRVKHAATAWITEAETEQAKASAPAEAMPEDSFFIICPHCSKQLEAYASMAGMEADCPYCENTLTVPKKESADNFEDSGDDEYVYFHCPSCNQAIEALAEDAGKRMNCQTCKAIVVIPESTELSPELQDAPKNTFFGNTIRIDIP